MQPPKNLPVLAGDQLNTLTDAWEIWARGADSPARAIARARLHLFFLLARFGGMRSAEISAFSPHAALDLETGLATLPDRRFFLPPSALRPLRRILSLPESRRSGFLQLDSGFVRRTFYNLADLAQLPPKACGPRALRYARTLELLNLHMPPEMVAGYLGITSPGQLASLLDRQPLPNHLTAILSGLETDLRHARLFFALPASVTLQGICSLEQLAMLEPGIGRPMRIAIDPGLVFPSPAPLPMANRLACRIVSATADSVASRILLAHDSGLRLLALPDTGTISANMLAAGAEIMVYIPAGAVQICR